ncbi:hypothetical protein I6H67_04920 [Pediococcus pentosaceus]|jgi:hypothetical protein|uniref:hypothetical protein n=1 Tax=Pediococcus pentosaceus TaxID=1255 RepID=UPI00132F8207|nr:hypothetical protein [Pediococcus pentosaceus]MBF7103957.1 hypothetical protein [Pediococcus pentosaceus]QHO68261.1 hypothetical protein C7M44_01696 [Pediococcus pentosaceus]QQC60670.1 hypothetical protein I6H67_05230 [Pediococcus pentosaceus]QQC62181.1 hypothetical protein I6H67_04920 [Pediococcus pentosaceus]
MKPTINVQVHVERDDQIKEVLPDIAPLKKKYNVTLTISVSSTATMVTRDGYHI